MVRGGRVGGISIISGVWVVRAVPPPTCAQGGSVGALDTPKLCPVGLKPPRGPSEEPRKTSCSADKRIVNGGSSSTKHEKNRVAWRKIV